MFKCVACLVRCELLTEGSKNVRHLPRYLFIKGTQSSFPHIIIKTM